MCCPQPPPQACQGILGPLVLLARTCPSRQIRCHRGPRKQDLGVVVDVSFARRGWDSDLSVEPWMNQPDHSHPTEMKVQTFSSDSPSNVHFLFPCSGAVAEGITHGYAGSLG